jgi:MFS family permease
VAGDAIFTTTIAGLVFLNVSDLNQARWKVALALVFTFVPFTLAAPFIGPLIDRARGGRKWMIVGLSALRAAACFALILTRGNALALYPLFLVMLVLSKGYVIARGTIVPSTVRNDAELVEANSKLSAISGFAAVAGGGPSLLIMKVGGDVGPDLALGLAGVVFAVSAVLAGQLPSTRTASLPPDELEEVELESQGIRLAARSVAFARGVVGFLTFMLAFYYKDI